MGTRGLRPRGVTVYFRTNPVGTLAGGRAGKVGLTVYIDPAVRLQTEGAGRRGERQRAEARSVVRQNRRTVCIHGIPGPEDGNASSVRRRTDGDEPQ